MKDKPIRLLTLLALLLTFSRTGWTQTSFKYGPELGVSVSQLPKINSYNVESRGDQVSEKTVPLISPLLGFYGQVILKKHLQFTGSLQYQITGKRYHYHRDGNDLLDGGTYTSDEWENQTFQKLCLPLTIGYLFRTAKLQPSIFAGIRPNFIFSGKYYQKSDSTIIKMIPKT